MGVFPFTLLPLLYQALEPSLNNDQNHQTSTCTVTGTQLVCDRPLSKCSCT